jgi:hypothetical protein
MKRKTWILGLIGLASLALVACNGNASSSESAASSAASSGETSASATSGTSSSNGSAGSSLGSSANSQGPVWNYSARDIGNFGSGTPSGSAHYDSLNDYAVIWNTDASLDNYGGVQTPTIALNFSKAVYFEMEVKNVLTEYIVKLAVAGQSESYYVLADESATGIISVNIVNAMLCAKFRARNTQPDPGYSSGWAYAGQTVNCAFNILAKGPDGVSQTAELDLGYVKISNDLEAVTGVDIAASAIQGGTISKLKGSAAVALSASVLPSTIANQNVLWQSADESIASVDSSGNVSFVGVGTTEINAESSLDQSISSSVAIDVLSGYENVSDLKTALAGLTYNGSAVNAALFDDLYATAWATSMNQAATFQTLSALATHAETGETVVENYFDPTNPSEVSEALSHASGSGASFVVTLASSSSALVYRSIGGKLYSEAYSSGLKASYATLSGSWAATGSYVEKDIVAKADGTLTKCSFEVRDVASIGNYLPADMMDSSQWVIPDRTKLSQDSTVNALSPATRSLVGGQLVLQQNKYPESKYCFGGIVSKLLTSVSGKAVQTLINVASTNEMNAYVKTMWEIRILYYEDDKVTPVSTTPIKIDGDNESGFFVHTFTPTHNNFRLYLVANGSDIGAQFPDAEIVPSSLKLYSVM